MSDDFGAFPKERQKRLDLRWVLHLEELQGKYFVRVFIHCQARRQLRAHETGIVDPLLELNTRWAFRQ
eukprot:scaffold7602_cov592-Pinguiococcus_pyrenoidosus.AAC.1